MESKMAGGGREWQGKAKERLLEGEIRRVSVGRVYWDLKDLSKGICN